MKEVFCVCCYGSICGVEEVNKVTNFEILTISIDQKFDIFMWLRGLRYLENSLSWPFAVGFVISSMVSVLTILKILYHLVERMSTCAIICVSSLFYLIFFTGMLLIKHDLTDEQSRNGTNKYLYIDICFVISEIFVVWDVVLPRRMNFEISFNGRIALLLLQCLRMALINLVN